MQIGSYCGKILQVDLTTGKIETKELGIEIAKRFIGDFGIGLRLAYDTIKPGIDPLSPLNAIIIAVGPLVGTQFNAQRWSLVTKYPLTGAIAFGNSGMWLGKRLKFAGYDHLVITGRADRPVYLKISDNDVQIRDAKHLWGKDIFQTTDELWQELGKSYSILAIGQAGENLVRVSLALVDRIATMGMGGLAAVMGSKNLKAIAVSGSRGITVSDQKRYKRITTPLEKSWIGDPERRKKIELGKAPVFEYYVKKGVVYKNWTELYPEQDAIATYGTQEYLKVKRKRVGCPGCPLPCKDVLEVKEGEYKGLTTNISSIVGRAWTLGIRCNAGGWPRLVKLIDTVNRYGIETYGAGPAIDLAIELYERGVITKKDTGGLVLRRDFETTAELLGQIAFRQGIGDVLADGSLGIIKRFGPECEKYSCTIKGIDAVMDPRATHTFMPSFSCIVNPEGGFPETAYPMQLTFADPDYSQEAVESYCESIGVPKKAMDRILYKPQGYNVARLTPYAQHFYTLLTCLGICQERTWSFDIGKLAELYSSATGIETNPDELREAAERIWNLFKAINVREGFDRKDDRIPPRWFEPLKTASGAEIYLQDCNGKPLSRDDMERLLDDYYEESGWEVERGIPTKAKLTGLGLTDIAEDLIKHGIRLT